MAIGLIPAIRMSRPQLLGGLKSSARDGGGRRAGVRSGLTVIQAAFSVLLLIGAGLFVKSLWQVQSLQLGLDADRVLSVSMNRSNLSEIPAGPARDSERARRRAYLTSILNEIAGLPGIQHSAVAIGLPFANRFTVDLRIPGLDSVPTLSTGFPSVSAVSSDYFATVGTRVLRGRACSRSSWQRSVFTA